MVNVLGGPADGTMADRLPGADGRPARREGARLRQRRRGRAARWGTSRRPATTSTTSCTGRAPQPSSSRARSTLTACCPNPKNPPCPPALTRDLRAPVVLLDAAPLVALVMGSDSDWATMKSAADILAEFGIAYEVEVVSAHRTPDKMIAFGTRGRRPRHPRDHRRRRRRGAPARDARLGDHAARDRRARRRSRSSTASTRCCRSCRCPPASRWRRCRSAGRATRACWPRASWRSADPALADRLAEYAASLADLVEEKNAALKRAL